MRGLPAAPAGSGLRPLSVYPRMMSWPHPAQHTGFPSILPITQLARGLVFPPGASDTQNKLIVIGEDDAIVGGVMSASQSPPPSFVPLLQLKRCRHWVKTGTSCASSVTAATNY